MRQLLVLVLGLSGSASAAGQEFDVSRIDKRIADWQPLQAERRFDDIGWAPDLCTALKTAKVHGRPTFLFTHDGRMQFGRC